ncbi:MAG: hypothetical protein JST12_20175 [Armatimonadetes bacterium]|nr:hypothetical protein [Armatimonadota bacterium]
MFIFVIPFVSRFPSTSLALTARFYGKEKAQARFQIYVMDLSDGSKKVLQTAEEPTQVRWVGRNSLAWFTKSGLFASMVTPWRPVRIKLAKGLVVDQLHWSRSKPGRPEIEDPRQFRQVLTVDLVRHQLRSSAWHELEGNVPLTDSKPNRFSDPNYSNRYVIVDCGKGIEYWKNGKSVALECEPQDAWTNDDSSRIWVAFRSGQKPSSTDSGLMAFQKGKLPVVLCDGAVDFDFWPKRPLFAYFTTPKSNNGIVSNELYLGNWKTMAKKSLVNGPVLVTSISIQP